MPNVGLTRRNFMRVAGGGAVLAGLLTTGVAHAEPQNQNAIWVANYDETRLLGADGQPVVGLPRWTHLRIMRSFSDGQIEVWVPRFSLVGRVPASSVGPVGMPTVAELAAEEAAGPPLYAGAIGLPGRVVGSANLRTWPTVGDNLLRTLGHNAPLRVLTSVRGDDGDEWYSVSGLDSKTYDPMMLGYVHNSLVRLPRLHYTPTAADHTDMPGRHFEADLHEPAMLTAFEDGGPVWSTLTLKGTSAN